MKSANDARTAFLTAKEATGPAKVSVWRILAGGPREDPYERWTRIIRDHGEVARWRYGFGETFLVSSAEGVKRVLQENAANYVKRHASYSMLRRVFGNGLFTSEGSFWLRQRRLAQPAFHSRRIAAMGQLMTARAVELAESWQARADGVTPVLMLNEMAGVTLKVVGDALFGTALGESVATITQSWTVLNAQMAERVRTLRLLPPILPTRADRSFRRARRDMLRLVDELIARKRTQEPGSGDDLLSMFLEARDEDNGEQMTDGQLRDEVITMLFAGHETTATALTWTWALLSQHPGAEEHLHQELRQVLGERAATVSDVPRLTYTKAVIEEAMRLRSPAFILIRHALDDDVVAGHRIHKGATVVTSPMLLHRNPAYWETPDAFVPERWLDKEAEARRPRFAYIPFGGGPRQCIGNNFAMMEAVLLLATLAQRFKARLAPGYLANPEYLVLARPAGGAPMTLLPHAE